MKVGAHVSTAGGVDKALGRAVSIGAETIQIFASSPRAWAFKPPAEEAVAAFLQQTDATGITPAFLHASYLVNLGGTPDLVRKSVDSLSDHLGVAAQLGAAGLIFHSGSHKGAGFNAVLEQASSSLREVLSRIPGETWLIIENAAGMGAHIGSTFREIGRLMDAVDSPRVMVCLDTAHTFAAGYNLADPDAIDGALEELDREIGLSRLVAVHANDSKVELGSGVDRHENIGDGHIGREGFEVIMGHPAFREVPFLLEVPGADGKGPDKENVERLKGIRGKLGISP